MVFFFVLENHSEPNFRVDFWVEYLNYGVNFWVEYLNYSNGGRIQQVHFVSKLIVGVGDVQYYSTKFASEFFSSNSIQGLKTSSLCSRLLGLFWSGTLGFWVANL